MSDLDQTNEKKEFGKNFNSPFFTFAKPYFDFIGKGTMFHIVYFSMAAVSILIPIGLIIFAVEMELFSIGPRGVVWFILTWLCAAFACWIGFQLWWNRKSQITDVKDSEFVVIPTVADIVSTFGEWIGTLVAIIGFSAGLFGVIILGDYLNLVLNYIGAGQFGALIIIIGPVAGFFIIILSKAIAEAIRIIVSIANSCRDIAKK